MDKFEQAYQKGLKAFMSEVVSMDTSSEEGFTPMIRHAVDHFGVKVEDLMRGLSVHKRGITGWLKNHPPPNEVFRIAVQRCVADKLRSQIRE